MKVRVIFPRTLDGQRIETVELGRVPCEGEYVATEYETYLVRGSVTHFANPGKNQPVAQISL